jgi:predicted PurR-regulated permease PerM
MTPPDRPPPGRAVKPALAGRLAREIGEMLAHYAGAQARICLVLTALYAAGFALLGVPWWPVFGILCGFAHAVPVFGAAVAALAAAGVTWIARGFHPAVGSVLVFAAASGLEGFYLTPRLMGRSLRLSPWLVFFGVLAASSLFGFVGVLLAVPVMALAAILWRFARSHLARPQ